MSIKLSQYSPAVTFAAVGPCALIQAFRAVISADDPLYMLALCGITVVITMPVQSSARASESSVWILLSTEAMFHPELSQSWMPVCRMRYAGLPVTAGL